jgi:hypothetical protein
VCSVRSLKEKLQRAYLFLLQTTRVYVQSVLHVGKSLLGRFFYCRLGTICTSKKRVSRGIRRVQPRVQPSQARRSKRDVLLVLCTCNINDVFWRSRERPVTTSRTAEWLFLTEFDPTESCLFPFETSRDRKFSDAFNSKKPKIVLQFLIPFLVVEVFPSAPAALASSLLESFRVYSTKSSTKVPSKLEISRKTNE